MGSNARVLLSSVFGPYAQDDEFGSRSINPMELYHNQVTRAQGAFSLRMFHRSWGIMMIQSNISAPTHAARFSDPGNVSSRNSPAHQYDIVGHLVHHRECRQGAGDVPARARALARTRRSWSAATSPPSPASSTWSTPTTSCAAKASPGCAAIWAKTNRAHSPSAHRLGIRHARDGAQAAADARRTAATIIPSVGCPMGCNFCTTSSFFGGKGKSHELLRHRRGAVRRDVR